MGESFRFSVFFGFVFAISALLWAQDKTAVAVLDLKGLGLTAQEVQIISARVRSELVQTNRFTVVEREKMKEILDEQGLQLSGCTNDECVVQAGRLLGVKQMIAGEIGKIGQMYTLTLRLFDVESGQINKTASEDCSCPLEDVLTGSVKKAVARLAGIASDTEKPRNLIDVLDRQPRKIRSQKIRSPQRQTPVTERKQNIDLAAFEIVNSGRIVKILPGRLLVRFNKQDVLAKGPCVIVRVNKKMKFPVARCRSQIVGFKKGLAVVKVPASCRPNKTDRVLIVQPKTQSQAAEK